MNQLTTYLKESSMMARYVQCTMLFVFLSLGSIASVQTDTIPGYTLQFSGSQYASIADSGDFNFSGSFTIEAWIKAATFASNFQTIIAKGDDSWRLHRYFNTNVLSFGTSGLSNGDLIGTTNVNDGQWHHVAAVYNGSQKLLYVDGNLDASVSVTGSLNASTYNTSIGENLEFTGRGWWGNIDEVRIWNVALTVDEIRSNIHRTLTGSETGLMAYYQFNDGSGTTLGDAFEDNDGTIAGSPTWITSTVAIGYGVVNSVTNFTSGTASLGNISITMSDAFDNSVDVYAFEIPLVPITYPYDAASYQGERYWIINTYGDGGTFSANLTFTYPAGELTVTDSGKLILYTRSSNSDLAWNSTVTGASSLTSTSVSFAGIGSFSQFAVSENPFAGGDGSSGNPYQIATHTQLNAIRNFPSSNFILTQDIDLSFHTGNSGGDFWNGGEGWEPIGTGGSSFSGTLNGNGHTIIGLSANRSSSSYIAFIGELGFGGEVSNLGLVNVSIVGDRNIGGLIGRNYGTVTNCYTTGSVSGALDYIGGLVGYNSSDISESYSQCEVTGNEIVGGLVGRNVGSITKSYATGTVEGDSRIGGFAGANASGRSISYSYATGNVVGTGSRVGGFIGAGGGTISDSYASGSVSGLDNVGGFAGRTGGTIQRAYSVGSVTGISTVGGFLGYADFENSNPSIEKCFWDTQTSGQTTSAGGTGKTTSEMKTQSTFTDSGWNFSTVWEIIPGYYPRLTDNADPALPVELVSLNIEYRKPNVELRWRTATELNNAGWEVQKSVVSNQRSEDIGANGRNGEWVRVGFIEGSGSSNSPKEYSFVDRNLKSGVYSYRLKQIDRDGKFSYSMEVAVEVGGGAPKEFVLMQNYPNPFNPTTTIEFTLPKDGHVLLKVYDMLGREVATLVNEERKAGVVQQVQFDASSFASGMYLYRLQSGGKVSTKKLMVVK